MAKDYIGPDHFHGNLPAGIDFKEKAALFGAVCWLFTEWLNDCFCSSNC
jgi:hypothetical protein